MQSNSNTINIPSKDAIIIPFEEYTVHYYSQSSAPWEAAYINCFEKTDPNTGEGGAQVGYIVFTYQQYAPLPGQEPLANTTNMPTNQMNRLESASRGRDFFVIYYDLARFDDVINILRYCKNGDKSMVVSADPLNHVWALCNNLRVPNGAQYNV